MRKELLALVSMFVLLLNDPMVAQAYMMVPTDDAGWEQSGTAWIDPFLGVNDDAVHLVYELNGGVNHNANPDVITAEELPFALEIPVRDGYNFAGWYTDSSYDHKITEITEENAANMVLFAKWTRPIDNRYNVEMYSYQTASVLSRNQKELKECNYEFLDELDIPGMPSTREKDYLDNLISSEGQCLQGLCFTPDYILMTAYADGSDTKGSLMIFERETGTYLATLGMKEKSHLGGIAFDGENVWICHSNSKTLERIPYEYIERIGADAPGYCVDASALSDEYKLDNIPSCITCYGGRIWVATHTKFFDSEMLSYSYDEEKDTLTSLSSYNIPNKVQGIAFDKGGQVYLSTSFGRNSSSYLKVYASLLTLTKHPNEPSAKVEMPPCSEEIAIADDNVYVLFESASLRYFEGTDGKGNSSSPIDKVLEVTVASIW